MFGLEKFVYVHELFFVDIPYKSTQNKQLR